MKYALLRSGGLLLAFAIGGLLPVLSEWSSLIRPLLVFMLFSSCLKVEPSWRMFRLSQGVSMLFGAGLAVLVWRLLLPLDESLAQAAFFAAITPTATAAPAIVGMIGGDVSYAVAAFLLSGVGISLLLPLLIPLVLHTGGVPVQLVGDVFCRIGGVMFLPLATALALRRFFPVRAEALARRLGPWSFFAWIFVVVLITANARAFIDALPEVPWSRLGAITVVVGVICAINFLAGYFIGGRYRLECSQCLGQKNNSYTVYLALAYANPIVALGPTIYVFFHNAWNAIQLYRHHAGESR